MAQPPFQVDGIQIEPGSGQTLIIDRNSSTGALQFKDAVVTTSIPLSSLANVGTIAGVLTVGKSGAGAKYTSIQSALNAVPVTSSETNPHVILIFPGVYTETLTITKDGVCLIGLGLVVVTPASDAATVTYQSSVSSTPRWGRIQGLTLKQTNDSRACVLVTGGAGSNVGSSSITMDGCKFLSLGVGGYTVYGDTVNNLVLRYCSTLGSTASTALVTTQCASLEVICGDQQLVQVDFNSAGSLPSGAVSGHTFYGCQTVGDVLGTLSGDSWLTFNSCPEVGDITINGDRTLTLNGSRVGTLVVNNTSAVVSAYSTYGAAIGAGTLQEFLLTGTRGFVAVDSMAVVFPVARPSAVYTVSLDAGISSTPWVSAKSETGFTIQFAAPQTVTVSWSVTV